MDSQPADPEAVAPVATDARADVGDMQLLGTIVCCIGEGDRLLIPCLARMGYKQELRRQYSTPQVFAIAFSIMGLVPSIASTLSFSLPTGPVGMVWVGVESLSVWLRCWLTRITE